MNRRIDTSPRALLAWGLLAVAVYAATWAVHLPLMLWDHTDLLPLYDAWQRADAPLRSLFAVHDGSHVHAAAYALLLATTTLSHGRPWLDCILSASLLLAQGVPLLRMARVTLPEAWRRAGWRAGLVLLVFHPGHLANLQWGWQVAVFLSTLCGVVLPVYIATRERFDMPRNLLALASVILGILGFSTAVAGIPAVLLVIAGRHDLAPSRRVALALPWIVLLAAAVAWLAPANGGPGATPLAYLQYTLNYLGGGVLRFAEGAAAPWTVLTLLAVAPAAWRARRSAAALPWLALMTFGAGAAVLTAAGRTAAFGVDHAFVTRYVSFSSLYWLGWLGLMLQDVAARPTLVRLQRVLAAVVLVLAAANGVHLAKKAAVVHRRALDYAATIRATYPHVDPAVLDAAFADRAPVAIERLEIARRHGFAPFDVAEPAPAR